MKKIALTLIVVVLALLAPLALASSGEEDHGAAKPDTYLGIPSGILKFANVVVFLGVLIFVLKGPISAVFKERGDKIKADLDEARQRQEKADSLAADIQARLDSIEQEVSSILERAKVDGEKQKQEIIESAKSEATKILTSARGEIEARVKLARQELTDHAGELAAEKAHSLLSEAMNDSDRQKVFADSVESIVETKS